MRLSEARKRFIGKRFRIKHAERGEYRRFYIEDIVGVCTDITAFSYYLDWNPSTGTTGTPTTIFRFRIETPDTTWRWFYADEIEPIE